jgi:hypothetical protein
MKVFLFLIVSLFIFSQCNAQVKDSSTMHKKSITEVLKENQDSLLAIPGVQGFYQGELENAEQCIVIMVDSLSERNKNRFPKSLDGYPVKVEVTGRIEPLNKNKQ